LWLPPGATDIGVSVGSLDLPNRVESSEVVTAWATAVRTLGVSSSPLQRGKEHYQ